MKFKKAQVKSLLREYYQKELMQVPVPPPPNVEQGLVISSSFVEYSMIQSRRNTWIRIMKQVSACAAGIILSLGLVGVAASSPAYQYGLSGVQNIENFGRHARSLSIEIEHRTRFELGQWRIE